MVSKQIKTSIIPDLSAYTEGGRPPRVALIDDDVQFERSLARILRVNYECVVNGYRSVEDFLVSIDRVSNGPSPKSKLDLILLDFHLPGKDGPKLVEELEQRHSKILEESYIMGVTGDTDQVVYNEFKNVGVSEILLKPLKMIDFRNIAERAYKQSSEEKPVTISTIPPKYV